MSQYLASSPSSAAARITSKFQITIPRVVRESIQARVGDSLVFVRDEAGFWKLIRVPQDPVEALRLAGQGLKGTVREVHEEFERGWYDEYRDQ